MFDFYRIKEINGKFIPQKLTSFIFFIWQGIGKNTDKLWYVKENQLSYCSFNSLEEAKYRIEKYKNRKSTVRYYYKVKL